MQIGRRVVRWPQSLYSSYNDLCNSYEIVHFCLPSSLAHSLIFFHPFPSSYCPYGPLSWFRTFAFSWILTVSPGMCSWKLTGESDWEEISFYRAKDLAFGWKENRIFRVESWIYVLVWVRSSRQVFLGLQKACCFCCLLSWGYSWPGHSLTTTLITLWWWASAFTGHSYT